MAKKLLLTLLVLAAIFAVTATLLASTATASRAAAIQKEEPPQEVKATVLGIFNRCWGMLTLAGGAVVLLWAVHSIRFAMSGETGRAEAKKSMRNLVIGLCSYMLAGPVVLVATFLIGQKL